MLNERSQQIITLYQQWLDGWNSRNANAMAALLADDSFIIGFDGSQMRGKEDLYVTLSHIFAQQPTAAYVAIIREIRVLSPGVAWLRADVGMVPAGKQDINPALNAVQTMIAVNNDGKWEVSVFQNTPAAFHGMPELADQLSADLRKVLKDDSTLHR